LRTLLPRAVSALPKPSDGPPHPCETLAKIAVAKPFSRP
jgi:hypothetical protein